MKRKRDWREARAKVEEEGRCRLCWRGGQLDAAHVIPRSLAPGATNNMGRDNIVPLCRRCHELVDSHQESLLPVLTLNEQCEAVRQAGGIAAAYRMTTTGRPK